MLFLIFGLITVAWSVVLWFYLPDSPSNAHFLSSSEREFASLRPKKFQRTTQTRKWDRDQFIESFTDPKTWWLLIFSFVICVPNGGTTSVCISQAWIQPLFSTTDAYHQARASNGKLTTRSFNLSWSLVLATINTKPFLWVFPLRHFNW